MHRLFRSVALFLIRKMNHLLNAILVFSLQLQLKDNHNETRPMRMLVDLVCDDSSRDPVLILFGRLIRLEKLFQNI